MNFGPLLIIPIVTALLLIPQAQSADTYAYVTQTSNASTLSLLDPANGAQFAGRVLGITTRTGAVLSPNGSTAFVIKTNEQTGKTNSVVGFGISGGKIAGTITFPGTVQAVALSPASGLVFVATSVGESKPGNLYQIDPADYTYKSVFQSTVPLPALAVSPDGGTIYASTNSALISISTSTFLQTASVPIADIVRIVVSPDGQRVYLTLNYPAPTGPMVAEYDPSTRAVIGSTPSDASAYIAVSPDSSSFYTTLTSPTGQTLLEQVGRMPFVILKSLAIGPAINLTGAPPLSISPNGISLAIASQLNEPDVTLVTIPSLTISSVTPVGNVCGISYASASDIVVTNCGADAVDIVDVTTTLRGPRFDAGPSPESTLLGLKGSVVYVSNPYGVWALQAKNAKILSKIEFPGPHQFSISAGQLALSANGLTLFAAYPLGVFEISTSTNQLIGPVPGIPSNFAVSAMATSAGADFLFVAGTPGNDFQNFQLLILDQATGNLITTVTAPVLGTDLVASKDGSTLYFEGVLGGVFYSLYQFGVPAVTFTAIPSQEYGNLALSPDNKTLYVAGHSIEAIDTTALTYTGIPTPVPALEIAVTPDGLDLVVTSTATVMGVIPIGNPIVANAIEIGGSTGGISLR